MQYYCFLVAGRTRTVTYNVNAFMATKLITRAARQCLGVIRQTSPTCFMLLLVKMLLLLLFLLLLMMLTMMLLLDQAILFMYHNASILLLLLLFYALMQMLFTIACIIWMLFLLVPFHLSLNVFTVHNDKYPKDTCTQE